MLCEHWLYFFFELQRTIVFKVIHINLMVLNYFLEKVLSNEYLIHFLVKVEHLKIVEVVEIY